jgi:hypothetical protein
MALSEAPHAMRFGTSQVVLWALIGAAPAWSNSVYGRVRLPMAKGCANVTVELRAFDSAEVIPLPVDVQCRFHVTDVDPGIYELAARADGFLEYHSSSFRLTANSDLAHDPSLTPAARHPVMQFLSSFLHSNLGAFLGVGGILVGLFELSRYFRRPTFGVHAKPSEPYCHTAEVWFRAQEQQRATATGASAGSFSAGPACTIHFCRVWVGNEGTHDAKGVEAFAVRLFEKKLSDAMPRFVPRPGFRPMNLRWANSWQIAREGVMIETPSLIKSRLSARTGRFLDIGFMVEPSQVSNFVKIVRLPSTLDAGRQGERDVRLFLALDSIGDDEGVALPVGEYILELVVDCDATAAERFYLYLGVAGWQTRSELNLRPANTKELLEARVSPQKRTVWLRLVAWWRSHTGRQVYVPD